MISHLEGEPTDAEDKDEDVGHEGGEVCRLALLCTLRNNQFLDYDDMTMILTMTIMMLMPSDLPVTWFL